MKAVNLLTFILVFLSFFILTGAGHGVAPLGFLELILIPDYLSTNGIFSDTPVFFIFLAFVGHIMLVLALMSKKKVYKTIFIVIGEVFILSTIIYLTKDYRANAASKDVLGWSIPAILSLIALTLCLFLSKRKAEVV